jgi:RHS repeat-associated protein
LIDSTGLVVWRAGYDPFGQAVVDPASTVENNLRLPGQYFDEETGLHYNWHRYYDPSTGRYLTPDPIGLAGGINIYSYVLNNPVNFIDPLGLATYYGNWGGPNWTGRYRKSWDQLTPEQQRRALSDPSRVPIDKQDVCYMHHDICYGNSRTKCADEPCPRDCEKKAFNKCDDELTGCLVNCGIMPNVADEIRRDLAIPTFVIQPAYRNRGYSDTSSESQSYYQFIFNF